MPKKTEQLSSFAVALKAHIDRAVNAGISQREISERSGINRTTMTKIVDGETPTPDMATIRALVHYFNAIGEVWSENEALAQAGYQAYDQIVDARMPISIEAMPYMIFETRIFDAERIATSRTYQELGYANKTNALKLSTATIGIIGMTGYDGYVILVETIGTITANSRVMVKTPDRTLEIRDITDPSEVQTANMTIIGTVIGYYSTADPHTLLQEPATKRRSTKSN